VRSGRLAGRTAVISGAGSVGPGWGNGRATAVIFAREGATVYLTDRDKDSLAATAEQIREEGGQAHTHLLDVTEPDAVRAHFEEVERAAGRIDILVNNVGGSRAGGVAELSLEDWESQLRTNLTSAFLACKEVVPVMRRGGGGAIVNTASASACAGPAPPRSATRRPKRP
jgi:NAD(P)-dependent dehydrogenase (short-subunit alcohol dehydrogenase family)